MPKNKEIKKVLVIGSGPIVIGQAAEFDYAGTQACSVLKKEGINVVLVNSNPATIMTDKAFRAAYRRNRYPNNRKGAPRRLACGTRRSDRAYRFNAAVGQRRT